MEIAGPAEMFVTAGSDATIECVTHNIIQAPDFVLWSFNQKVSGLQYFVPISLYWDVVQMLVDVAAQDAARSCCELHSTLRLNRVEPRDEGRYTCRPAGLLASATVNLHVLQTPVAEERLPSQETVK